MKKALLLGGFFVMILTLPVSSQSMVPDTLFGAFSNLQVSPGEGDVGYDLLYQPDEKIIYGGLDYAQDGYYIDMVRFDNCGDIDSSFGTDGIVHTKFDQRSMGYSFRLQDDNKILCGGQQAPGNAGSTQIPCISRFNVDGSTDMSFNGTGFNSLRYDNVSSGSFNSVFEMPDSRILCIGTCSGNANGGVNGIGLMRFNPDGTLDPTFSADGKAVYSDAVFTAFGKVYGHLLQSGKIIAVASVWDASYIDHFFAMAFDPTGEVDYTFGNGGFFNDDVPLVVYGSSLGTALQADDKVLLMANRTNATGIEIIRITPDGIIDSTFGTYGHSNINIAGMTARRIKVLSDGKIMILGGYNYGYGVGCAVMLNDDGSVNYAFGSDGFMIFDLNNNSGTHYLEDLLEVSLDHWVAGGSTNDFLIRKYTDLSNVPHIYISGPQLVSTGTGIFQWYLNDVMIPGESSNTYTPNENGIYSVGITDNFGCSYLSDPFELNNVGISEQNPVPVSVYPNPFSDKLQIRLFNSEPVEIALYDLSSRIILQKSFSETITLDVRELPAGLYFYKISNQNGVLSKGKLVRED